MGDWWIRRYGWRRYSFLLCTSCMHVHVCADGGRAAAGRRGGGGGRRMPRGACFRPPQVSEVRPFLQAMIKIKCSVIIFQIFPRYFNLQRIYHQPTCTSIFPTVRNRAKCNQSLCFIRTGNQPNRTIRVAGPEFGQDTLQFTLRDTT